MNCPRCGEVCCCHLEPPPAALLQLASFTDAGPAAPNAAALPDLLHSAVAETATQDLGRQESVSRSDGSDPASEPAVDTGEQDDSAWRDELSLRLDRYRARRKMRPPRYPSLRLQFDAIGPVTEPCRSETPQAAPITFAAMSDRALALAEKLPNTDEAQALHPLTEVAPAHDVSTVQPASARNGAQVVRAKTISPKIINPKVISPKIIEFPRFIFDQLSFEPPAPPRDQLAEPVIERPRILEVPEIEPPLPALGGITIEPIQRPEREKRPGIDIPLQSASLSRRILATLIDGMIVSVASVLFGYIFWEVAAVRPPVAQMFGLAAGISFVFWVGYQYLLLVYAGGTPGLRASGLELARFDGSRTTRSLRRWRLLASYLSLVSLGMGYAWVFLDEDLLCWHDRITHTYLAPRKRAASDSTLVR